MGPPGGVQGWYAYNAGKACKAAPWRNGTHGLRWCAALDCQRSSTGTETEKGSAVEGVGCE